MNVRINPPLYERPPAYPKPPRVSVPEISDEQALQFLGYRQSSFARHVARLAIRLSGFRSFHSSLPDNLEHLLSTVNIRLPGLDALAISATVALADDPTDRLPVERAASLIFAAYELYHDLKEGRFPPDTHRGQTLEMGQYLNLFGTSLTVKNGRARLVKVDDPSWILVLARRRLFRVRLGVPGRDTSFVRLVETLSDIAENSRRFPRPADEVPIGILTACDHRTQLRTFRQMERTPKGGSALETLRQNFLAVCLDLDVEPATYGESAFLAHSGNPFNRWYHQSLQIVVFGNARAAAIFNFTAYIDGNTMMRAASELQKRAEKFSLGSLASAEGYLQSKPEVTENTLSLPRKSVPVVLSRVREQLDNQRATFVLKLGKRDFEKVGLPPVPAFVVGLEAALLHVTYRAQPIHQFLSMSKYCCLGLTTAEVSTQEVLEAAEYLNANAALRPQDTSFRSLADRAVASQIEIMRRSRRQLDFPTAMALFWRTRAGIGFLRAVLSFKAAGALLALFGRKLARPKRRAVVISHPTAFENVPVVGRPGVRPPYVDLFGLHYQIFDDRTVLTFMPGRNWSVPNGEMADQIWISLERMLALLRPVEERKRLSERREVEPLKHTLA